MLFNVALFSSLLLSPVVLAVPSGLGTRIARRGENFQSNSRLERDTGAISNNNYPTTGNWAGASWSYVNKTFDYITGTFVVPTPSGAPGSSASVWVGIDGFSCPNALLQAGIYITLDDLDQPSYSAWYEWFPEASNSFSDSIAISAGDQIKLSVQAWSLTVGIATVENLTNGQTVSKALNSSTPLCLQDVEWVVEDYVSNGALVPLADFGTVTFTDSVATGLQDRYPNGATLTNIEENGQILTNTTITPGTTILNVQYV